MDPTGDVDMLSIESTTIRIKQTTVCGDGANEAIHTQTSKKYDKKNLKKEKQKNFQ